MKFYGGCYSPEKEQILAIREAIMKDGKGFHKVIDAKAFTTLFGTLQGEANKVLPPEFKAAAVRMTDREQAVLRGRREAF